MTIEDYIRSRVKYDPGTGHLLWITPSPNNRCVVGEPAGFPNFAGYLLIKFRNKGYLAHRVAWLLTHGEWPTTDIDHINGNKADNRLCNLRMVSRSVNCRNRAIHRAGHLPGTSYRSDKGAWAAMGYWAGKTYYFGLYQTAQEAHRAHKIYRGRLKAA